MKSIALFVLALVDVITCLECAAGTDVIGVQGDYNDIGGCGMESCDDRYDKTSVEECAAHCSSLDKCRSYTWTSLGGDQNHGGVYTCTVYETFVANQKWGTDQIMCSRAWPDLECPRTRSGISYEIVGVDGNNDIGGCGMESCDERYDKATIRECAAHCVSIPECISYTWTSMSGDQNHGGVRTCTVYDGDVPNQKWGPNQIMCSRPKRRGGGRPQKGGRKKAAKKGLADFIDYDEAIPDEKSTGLIQIQVSKSVLHGVMAVVILLLTANIMFLCYMNCMKNSNGKKVRYSKVVTVGSSDDQI